AVIQLVKSINSTSILPSFAAQAELRVKINHLVDSTMRELIGVSVEQKWVGNFDHVMKCFGKLLKQSILPFKDGKVSPPGGDVLVGLEALSKVALGHGKGLDD